MLQERDQREQPLYYPPIPGKKAESGSVAFEEIPQRELRERVVGASEQYGVICSCIRRNPTKGIESSFSRFITFIVKIVKLHSKKSHKGN